MVHIATILVHKCLLCLKLHCLVKAIWLKEDPCKCYLDTARMHTPLLSSHVYTLTISRFSLSAPLSQNSVTIFGCDTSLDFHLLWTVFIKPYSSRR